MQHVLVCNAGVVTGSSREDLLEVFHRLGSVPLPLSVALLPGKSYSFLSFASSTEAEEATNAVNGKEGLQQQQPQQPLYLAYVDRIPERSLEGAPDFSAPSGLILCPDFVSEEEEGYILGSMEWEEQGSNKSLRNR